MSRSILLFGFALCTFAQTVSNIRFDGVGDSSARVLFDVTGSFNAFRIRYGTSDTVSGAGGFLQLNGTAPSTYSNFDQTGNISGLAPATLYYVSPEVSSDGGVTWSSGISARLMTLSRTQTLPIAPTPVSTTFPAQTGTTRNVAADCSNLQSTLNAAAPGDTVVVPAGTICAGNYTLPNAPGIKSFTSANVRTSDSTVTVNNHGLTDNQEIRLSAAGPNANCLPGMAIFPYGVNCDKGGGWRKGARYWVHVVDTNNVQILDGPGGNPVIPGWIQFSCSTTTNTITFKPTWQSPNGFSYLGSAAVPANTVVQFHSTGTLCGGLSMNTNYYLLSNCPASVQVACTTQVSLSSGGSPVTITSTGSGIQRLVDQGTGTMYIGPAPDPSAAWIVLKSGGTVLPQADNRISPGFDGQMFHLRQNTPLQYLPGVLSTGILTHNWRVIGAIFDTATNNDYLTTTDPRGYCGILVTGQDSENIIFDRTRVQGPGYPNRFGCATAIFLDGRNIGVTNSDWRGMDYWHPYATGFSGSFTFSQVTLGAGNAYAGRSLFNAQTTANTVITVTQGGGVTGTIYVYFGMDGKLKVLPPLGVSLACTTSGTTCSVQPGVTNPTWPVDGNGRTAAFKIATFNLTAGSITAVCAGGCTDPFSSANASEGAASIIAGNGPGPYLFDNNFISGTGIPLHFDDSGGPFLSRTDYTITRNTFDVPASQLATQPLSDGLRYGHRNSLEWKGGERIKVDGNIFQGSFSEQSPACLTVAITPRSGGFVSDFDFTNNSVLGCGGVNIPSPIDSYTPVSKPAPRSRVANNVFLLNGPAYVVKGVGVPRGWTVESGYGTENVLIDHNTVFDARGTTPAFVYWVSSPSSGMTITNNIFTYTGNLQAVKGENVSPGCGFITDKALMDCAFTNGPGNPAYKFSNNVIVPSWADSTIPTGSVLTSTVQNAFPSPLKNLIPNGNSLSANLGIIRFSASNTLGTYTGLDLRLSSQSPYLASSTDGTQAGADLEKLQQAQSRIIQLRPLTVSSTGATIAAFVPRAGDACSVGYGTSNLAGSWTWTAPDTTNSRQRNIPITGLTSQTKYFFSMSCTHTAMPSIEDFRTE